MRSAITRRSILMSSGAAAAALMTPLAFADNYPTRAITLIVPYSAGGGTDVAARLVAPALSDTLKQPVLVVNKPGAGSIIGIQYAAHAEPDGYTLLFTACDGMVMDPAMYEDLPYDTAKDFIPITDVMTFPLFLIVRADSPIRTVRDLVDQIKAHPEKANYASSSAVFWLGSELFLQKAGAHATRVPYKGAGDMVAAVLQGQVLFALPSPPPTLGQAKSGGIRILATTAPARLPALPNVPTMAEAGIQDVVITDWSGMWAPAKTPQLIINTLNAAMRQVLARADIHKTADALSLGIAGASVDGIRNKMAADLELWKKVAEAANIKVKL
jgi:tripartite-type tricarboxylate transporter receptor subunit TctC